LGYEFLRGGPSIECGAALQRLFSTFANGWPGRGLLLLRVVVFSYLIYDALEVELTVVRVVAALAGVFLIMGFGTPLAGGLAAVLELWISVSGLNFWPSITASAIAAGLAMLGPGAWSVDARLFGRKRISIGRR
jgi:putative oxidoreductase